MAAVSRSLLGHGFPLIINKWGSVVLPLQTEHLEQDNENFLLSFIVFVELHFTMLPVMCITCV